MYSSDLEMQWECNPSGAVFDLKSWLLQNLPIMSLLGDLRIMCLLGAMSWGSSPTSGAASIHVMSCHACITRSTMATGGGPRLLAGG